MKTETGYIYHEGISAERKPERPYHADYQLTHEENMHQYLFDLGEWYETLIPATNIFYCHLNKVWCITRPHPEYRWEFTPGQKVEYNEGEVTKIL